MAGSPAWHSSRRAPNELRIPRQHHDSREDDRWLPTFKNRWPLLLHQLGLLVGVLTTGTGAINQLVLGKCSHAIGGKEIMVPTRPNRASIGINDDRAAQRTSGRTSSTSCSGPTRPSRFHTPHIETFAIYRGAVVGLVHSVITTSRMTPTSILNHQRRTRSLS